MIAATTVVALVPFLTTPEELLERPAGSVTILDARPGSAYREGHLPAAVRIDWTDYRAGWWRSGRLPDDLDDVARRLSALGVDPSRPVVVYDAARDGWGEAGRIVWMLAYLGHPDVTLLEGGWPAWRAAGGPASTTVQRAPPGSFVARPRPSLRASADDVERARHGAGILLDVRSLEEWQGATPNFEPRGGHVPGAVHLEWKDLLDAAGRLDAKGARARLAAVGVTPDRPVITYCTGGVRSATAWVLLRALGFGDVRNYDGSWWEWSGDRSRPVARVSSPSPGAPRFLDLEPGRSDQLHAQARHAAEVPLAFGPDQHPVAEIEGRGGHRVDD